MADVPEDLLGQIRHLEKIFTVDQAKLKEVTRQFVRELGKGKPIYHFLAGADHANNPSRS